MVGPPPESWAVEPSDAKAYELAPGLWSFRLPLAWDGISAVNAFAIERDDGIALVDCGTAGHPSCAEALRVAVEQTGYKLEDVSMLVGTHTHSDHVGLAQWVKELSGAEFWMHPDTAHFYDGTREPERIRAAREHRARQEGVPEDELGWYGDVREETEGVLAAVPPDHDLVAGVRLDSKLGEWETIETPGHCPSHVCLVQRDRGLIILGDLVAAAFSPWYDYGYSPDPVAEFLAALDTIAALDSPGLALPGHGRPISDLPGAIELHRRGVAERLEQTRAAIAAGPAGASVLTPRVFGEPDSGETAVWKMTELVCYLRHLRLAGEVVRDEDGDGKFIYRLAG
jgi:glyoxylase-like metal-dependent hydrolase (beta-lactamase superfamily II)